MNFKEIQELIKLIGRSDLAEFKMKDGEFELSIRTKFYNASRQQVVQTVAPAPATLPTPISSALAPAPQSGNTEAAPAPKSEEAAPKSDKKYLEIKSPIVGTFYRSSSPDKPAYVKVGDRVEAGNVVCIIEAMKLFNEIESEITGTIVKVMVDDAQPVEYDQVLFLLEA